MKNLTLISIALIAMPAFAQTEQIVTAMPIDPTLVTQQPPKTPHLLPGEAYNYNGGATNPKDTVVYTENGISLNNNAIYDQSSQTTLQPKFLLQARSVVKADFIAGLGVFNNGYIMDKTGENLVGNTNFPHFLSGIYNYSYNTGVVKYSGGSYSRYGAWNTKNSLIQYMMVDGECPTTSVCTPIETVAGIKKTTTLVDSDVFAGGSQTPNSSMPRGGSVTYTGSAIRNTPAPTTVENFANSYYVPWEHTTPITVASVPMTFKVNFGNRVMSGTSGSSADFGSALQLNGLVLGNGFVGLARSGGSYGGFSGNFYGPAAQELAGTAKFQNANLNTAFGGTK